MLWLLDRGSTPLASTTEGTSQKGLLGVGLSNKTACSFLYSDKEFLKLISAEEKRDEINRYLYKVDLIANYLPHLNTLGNVGRAGKTYSK